MRGFRSDIWLTLYGGNKIIGLWKIYTWAIRYMSSLNFVLEINYLYDMKHWIVWTPSNIMSN